jgi:colicin import membrane protein
MSDIFIKGDLNDLISSVENESVQLPQWLNIIDRKTESASENVTSDNAMTQLNNLNINTETSVDENTVNSVTSTFNLANMTANFSATSDNNDIFISQMGGNIEKTMASPDDINNLINMITSENVNENFNTVTTITNTSVLEDQLRELLTQAGGAKKASKKASKKSKKSSKKSKKASKKKSSKKQKGGAKKKASKKSSKKASKKASKKPSKKGSKKSVGGKKKASKKTASKKTASKKSKKASKKSSKKSKKYSKKYKGEHEESTEENVEAEKTKPEKKKRAPNPGFTAFLELKKFVAKKLGIPNGIPAGKIAGMAKKEYTEKNEGISAEEASKGAMKYFEDNIEKFKEELAKIQK